MELVKLGKKGQVTIPRPVLRSLGLTGEASLMVDTTPDGGILLRPVGVYPIEIYSEERVAEFERENAVSSALEARVRAVIEESH